MPSSKGRVMITLAEVEKLGRVHAVEPVVLSVYLNVPRSAAELASLPGRVDKLAAAAVRNAGRAGCLREADRRSAREEAMMAGPDWPGHPVAMFACAEVGLLEVVVLPEARLVAEMFEPTGGLTAVGLRACLAAVNAGAMETLVVPYDGLVSGYECGRCGALGLTADCCSDWEPRRCRCPTSSRRWSAGHWRTAARSSWFTTRPGGSRPGRPDPPAHPGRRRRKSRRPGPRPRRPRCSG